MNNSEAVLKLAARELAILEPATAAAGGLSVRAVTHRLRPEIKEKRRLRVQWVIIAVPILRAAGIDPAIVDVKEWGRIISGYHREPLSKAARAAMAGGGPPTPEKAEKKQASTGDTNGVETPGVRGPAIANPFALD